MTLTPFDELHHRHRHRLPNQARRDRTERSCHSLPSGALDTRRPATISVLGAARALLFDRDDLYRIDESQEWMQLVAALEALDRQEDDDA